MKFDDEKMNKYLFKEFADFVENRQSSECLDNGFEYEKIVDDFKSVTFETWKYYLPNYDENKARYAYLRLDITHEGKNLSEIKSKLENNQPYEIFVNLFGYYPILGNSNIYCLNLLNYREIFLGIINQHTHIGGVILDFIFNYLKYNGYHLNSQLKEKFENKYLTDFKYYVRDLTYMDYELEEKYVPNTIIHDDRQVLSSDLIGNMDHGHRFLIISSHMHQMASEFDFDVFRAWTGHFKVLDVFKYNGCCQITLLHLPEDLWMAFEDIEFEIDLVDDARKCFINSFDKKHYDELDVLSWLNSSFPIGLNENGDYIESFYTNHTSDGRCTAESKMTLKTKMIITRQLLNYYSPELKEGKYPAPKWLVYPEIPLGSIGWRMGYGEEYAMNTWYFTLDETYKKLFPEPLNWSRKYQKEFENYIKHKVYPLYVAWNPTGTPKYSFDKIKDYPSKDKIILVDDYFGDSLLHGEFRIGAEKFNSFYEVKHAKESVEEDIWDKIKYTVYLNALYYRIMEDDYLKNMLLESEDKIILFDNPDEYFGVRIEDGGFMGQNHIGFALMEVRDELRRIYKNSDSIDWFLTEYLKY